jgi:adenosine/AMP kinase
MELQVVKTNVVSLCDSDYDYILIGCGYIDRLEAMKRELIDATEYDEGDGKRHDLVYFVYFSNKYVARIQHCDDMVYRSAMEAQKKVGTMRDSVCVRVSDYSDNLIAKIKSMRHCGFFSEESQPFKVASFNTHTGKRVLYVEYDTESG